MANVTADQLGKVYNFIERLRDEPGQDRSLLLEYTQAALLDLVNDGQLEPTTEYVARYCDIVDGPADIEQIAAEIDAML